MANTPPQINVITQGCLHCGSTNLRPEERRLTEKRRSKFGLMWLLISIFTMGIGFLVWLVWPRHKVTVGVDRFVTCRDCGTRQP